MMISSNQDQRPTTTGGEVISQKTNLVMRKRNADDEDSVLGGGNEEVVDDLASGIDLNLTKVTNVFEPAGYGLRSKGRDREVNGEEQDEGEDPTLDGQAASAEKPGANSKVKAGEVSSKKAKAPGRTRKDPSDQGPDKKKRKKPLRDSAELIKPQTEVEEKEMDDEEKESLSGKSDVLSVSEREQQGHDVDAFARASLGSLAVTRPDGKFPPQSSADRRQQQQGGSGDDHRRQQQQRGSGDDRHKQKQGGRGSATGNQRGTPHVASSSPTRNAIRESLLRVSGLHKDAVVTLGPHMKLFTDWDGRAFPLTDVKGAVEKMEKAIVTIRLLSKERRDSVMTGEGLVVDSFKLFNMIVSRSGSFVFGIRTSYGGAGDGSSIDTTSTWGTAALFDSVKRLSVFDPASFDAFVKGAWVRFDYSVCSLHLFYPGTFDERDPEHLDIALTKFERVMVVVFGPQWLACTVVLRGRLQSPAWGRRDQSYVRFLVETALCDFFMMLASRYERDRGMAALHFPRDLTDASGGVVKLLTSHLAAIEATFEHYEYWMREGRSLVKGQRRQKIEVPSALPASPSRKQRAKAKAAASPVPAALTPSKKPSTPATGNGKKSAGPSKGICMRDLGTQLKVNGFPTCKHDATTCYFEHVSGKPLTKALVTKALADNKCGYITPAFEAAMLANAV